MTEINYPGTSPVVVEYVNGQSEAPAPVVEDNQPEVEVQAGMEPAKSTDQTEPPPVDKEQEKFASRFAALSRKEKELIQKERAFKEQQQQIQAYQKALADAKKNPVQLLQAAGFKDLEEALSVVINEGKEPTEQDRIQAIEQQIEAYKQQQLELARRAQEFRKEQELKQIHNNISEFVQQNSEQFELVTAYNQIDTVWSVIERTYLETQGQVHLTIEQACQAVEEQLESEKQQELEQARKTKKLSKLFGQLEVSKSNEVSKTVSPTLTNHGAVTEAAPPKKYKTREESLAAAAKLLKWNDNK